MKAFLRSFGTFTGFVLNLLGAAGLSDQVATWARWLSVVHRYVGNPFIYLGLTVAGSLVLAFTWAEMLMARKLAKAGGVTRREFPAQLKHWDRVSSFTISQVAWLWVELVGPEQSVL